MTPQESNKETEKVSALATAHKLLQEAASATSQSDLQSIKSRMAALQTLAAELGVNISGWLAQIEQNLTRLDVVTVAPTQTVSSGLSAQQHENAISHMNSNERVFYGSIVANKDYTTYKFSPDGKTLEYAGEVKGESVRNAFATIKHHSLNPNEKGQEIAPEKPTNTDSLSNRYQNRRRKRRFCAA